MIFRKYALGYRDIKVIAFISSIFCWAYLIYLFVRCLKENISFGTVEIFLLICIFGIFFMFWLSLWDGFNEFILIDETGISCYKSNRLEWKCTWDSIAKLKRCTCDRWPGVRLVLYDKKGIPDEYGYRKREFQLCRTAKEALEKYYYSQGKKLE